MLQHPVMHHAHRHEPPPGHGFLVRSFQPDDQPEVWRLYHRGLLAGHVDPYDPAADLDRIEEFYIGSPHRHFWVAEAFGKVVGTVAIAEEEDGVAHLRRLRVAPEWQDKSHVAVGLIKTATAHAREHGALKLIFHTPVDDTRAKDLLGRLGFHFARIREINGRQLLEFYVDLYERMDGEDDMDAADFPLQ